MQFNYKLVTISHSSTASAQCTPKANGCHAASKSQQRRIRDRIRNRTQKGTTGNHFPADHGQGLLTSWAGGRFVTEVAQLIELLMCMALAVVALFARSKRPKGRSDGLSERDVQDCTEVKNLFTKHMRRLRRDAYRPRQDTSRPRGRSGPCNNRLPSVPKKRPAARRRTARTTGRDPTACCVCPPCLIDRSFPPAILLDSR
jgi:hypothetical protein